MPIGFWNDPDGSKYRAAYFERFPNVWCHGDYAVLTEHGGLVIFGRSDAVLNPGGVRIGTAEIYRQVEKLDEDRSRASPSARTGTTTCASCCSCDCGRASTLDAALEKRIRDAIRAQHDAAPRAGEDRRGAGHPAHDQRQDRRARRARRRSTAARSRTPTRWRTPRRSSTSATGPSWRS